MRTLSLNEMHLVAGGNGDVVTDPVVTDPTPTPEPVTCAPVLSCLSLIKFVCSLPKFCLPKTSYSCKTSYSYKRC